MQTILCCKELTSWFDAIMYTAPSEEHSINKEEEASLHISSNSGSLCVCVPLKIKDITMIINDSLERKEMLPSLTYMYMQLRQLVGFFIVPLH